MSGNGTFSFWIKLFWATVLYLVMNGLFVFLLSFMFVNWWVFPDQPITYAIDAAIASAVLALLPYVSLWISPDTDSGFGMSILVGGWLGGVVMSFVLMCAKILEFVGIVASLNLEQSIISYPLAGGVIGALSVGLFTLWEDYKMRRLQRRSLRAHA